MGRTTSAFTANPTSLATHFPGAGQAADYDEELVTKTHGKRPRRSEVLSPPATRSEEADAASTALAESDPEPSGTPPTSESAGRVHSALFAGELSAQPQREATALARSGIRGWLNRLGLHLAPGPQEAAQRQQAQILTDAQTTIRQATWTRAVSILVANPKGGTGKTPLALLLGGALAAIRGGSVAILEVADDPGALAYRAEGTARLGVGDLVRDAADITTAGQLAGYTAPQTSFAAVIGSTTRRPRLEADDVTAMVQVIDEYYSIRVMDSGNQPTSSAFQGALATTDVLVVPVVNAGDSTLEAVRMLEGLIESGGWAAEVASRAIVVRVTDGRPESVAINAEVERVMSAAGVAAICDLPYDPHIAERGQLTLATLHDRTRDALTAIAAVVVESLKEHASQRDRETTK